MLVKLLGGATIHFIYIYIYTQAQVIYIYITSMAGKMAPLWVACHLSLSAVLSLSVLTCFMLCLMQCASSVLTYDRLSLLNLEEISNKLLYQATSSPHYAPPPLLLSIPDCLRRWPCSLPARRCRRRRGRRGS